MKPTPPKHALRFLRWFCREDYLEEIEGDLTELYEDYYEKSPGKARWKFAWSVMQYFRPAFIKSFRMNYYANPITMFRHNLLLTYRNFKRYKSSFFINLTGLSIGLACALLIYLWVDHELSIDKFHANDLRLYQVMKNNKDQGEINTGEDTPGLLARTLTEEMPEIESAVAVFPPAEYTFKGILSVEDRHMKGKSKFADKAFFDIFSYPIVAGSIDRITSDKSSIAISEDLAKNLFRTPENAIGKMVEWKGERLSGEFKVAGIFRTPSAVASIQFDIVFSYGLLLEKFPGFLNWWNNGPSTYVLLRKSTNLPAFNNKIAGFIKTKHKESDNTLFVRPYSDRYLYGDYENGVLAGGRIIYVKLFSAAAIFILLIACINFMNLSTSKVSRRSREVGVKKAFGAGKYDIKVQYLGEALLLAFLSLALAVLIVKLFLPQFNEITGKQLASDFSINLVLWVLAITFFTGLVSGSYPAFYLSAFSPVTIMKGTGWFGKNKNWLGAVWVRKGLVVFQFVVSIILIVSVLVAYGQMNFMGSKNLGFDRENVVVFTPEGKFAQEPEIFLPEIKKIPGVINASYMYGDLTGLHGGTTAVTWEGKEPDKIVDFGLLGGGYDLIETLGIEMGAGRSFSEEFGSESSKVIFNEVAIERMGLLDPVGKTITLWGEEKQIIGVVKNFHFESLYENVKPLIFRLLPNSNNILVKIRAGAERETLARLEEFYKEYNLGLSFDYKFLNEDYRSLYKAEQRISSLSKYFAGIAILISCLGLLGLAAFTVERRIKEIGIRKVLGAGEFGIIRLLTRDFTGIVLVAIIIALPVSYFIATQWLASFAYRIDLKWWYFISAGSIALLIAWFTVGLQTAKAAGINPVRCLKNE